MTKMFTAKFDFVLKKVNPHIFFPIIE